VRPIGSIESYHFEIRRDHTNVDAGPAAGESVGARDRIGSGTAVLAAVAVAATMLATSLGLFGYALGPYDECALALGGRLVAAGALPYRDFYTTYGPLGYTLMAPLVRAFNPGIAVRGAQCATGIVLGTASLLAAWALDRRRRSTWIGLLGFWLAASTTLLQPHFLPFAVAAGALAAALLARRADSPRTSLAWLMVAGAALGILALLRPAFAIYTAGAITASFFLIPQTVRAWRAACLLAGVTGLLTMLLWSVLYHDITPGDFYAAAVRIPALLARSSARFFFPAFLGSAGATAQLFYFGLALGGLHAAAHGWVLRVGSRTSRLFVWLGAAVAASAPALFAATQKPGPVATTVTIAVVGLAAAAIAAARVELGASRRLAAAATCGLAADAFLHYLLSRPDVAHYSSSLAFAVAGAALAVPTLAGSRRWVAAALVVVGAAPLLFYPICPSPIAKFPSVLAAPPGRWPAAGFPTEAVKAVELADARASGRGRFVAVASSHERTEASAVVLFLLSHRPPYTRWWAYDPGVQSSPMLQAMMSRELDASGSRTAVVWDARALEDPRFPRPEGAATAFDRHVRELYPVVIGRFGAFEVREVRDTAPAVQKPS